MGNEMSTVTEVNEYIDDDGGYGNSNNMVTGIAGNTKNATSNINNAPNTNDYHLHNALDCSDEQLAEDDDEDVVLRNPQCNSNNKEKVMVLS